MTDTDRGAFGLGSVLMKPLAENWWLILLRGVFAILFGITALVFPGITLVAFVWVFGAFALVDGLFSIAAAIRGGTMTPRWWLAIVGIAGIAAGILAAVWPGMTALLLLTFIGAWSIVRGLFEIVGAFRLRRHIDNEWMLIGAGALSVLFGILVLVAPGAGALALLWLIGVYAILSGLMLVGLAFRLRSHRQAA
jgi:uncharacterized membrane protein HdeD (DUF308 family)